MTRNLISFIALCAAFWTSLAHAQTRVVTIGDSWAGYVANGAPGSSANSGTGNSVQLMLDIFHPGTSVYNGSFYGGTAAQHAADLNSITAKINAAGPDVDVVWLSSGGNDLLLGGLGGGYSRLNTPAQNAAVYNAMAANLQTVVNHILSIRPDIQIVIPGYDYINVWDGPDSSLNPLRLNLGLIKSGNTGIDLLQNADLNQAFKDSAALTKAIADGSRRVHYINNFGINNTTAGYNGYFGTAPAQSYPPEAYPFAPTPTSRMVDPIHLNTTGYNVLALNAEANFFNTAFLSASLATSASTLDFGLQRVGTTANLSVTASNAGPVFTKVKNLTFGAATGEFGGAAAASNPLFNDPTLGSDTASNTYSYTPTDRGSDLQYVVLTSDSGSPGLTLQGQGVGPQFEASVSLLDFGSAAGSLPLEIANASTDANGGNQNLTNLTLLSAEIVGPDAALFSLSGFLPGMVLSKGQLANLLVEFAGGSAGTKSATLVLQTDEGAALGALGATFTITLMATVPEPSSLLLMTLGVAGLAALLACHRS
jgi:lysophospholipase L1-like esterase